jgi:hypothetical protein
VAGEHASLNSSEAQFAPDGLEVAQLDTARRFFDPLDDRAESAHNPA